MLTPVANSVPRPGSGGDAGSSAQGPKKPEVRCLDRFVPYSGAGWDLCQGRTDLQPESQRQLEKVKADPRFSVNVKVVIIGPASVGKTCLAVRFCDNTFDAHYRATLGVDFLVKRYKVWGMPLELNIWDTAGEERYRAVTQPFYRGALACVLCFDVNDDQSFVDLPRWIKQVQDQNPDIFMFLVGNKCDLYNVVGRERCAEFAVKGKMEYFETSALQNTSVDALFDRVTSVVVDDFLAKEYSADVAVPEPRGVRRQRTGSGPVQLPSSTTRAQANALSDIHHFDRQRREKCEKC
eukprot:RCo031927